VTSSDRRVALTIAGSDSSGGAGIQADLKTFAALGVYGASAITAVTAQSTIGVVLAAVLSADLVTAQIEAVAGDIDIHAVKTGMLGDAAVVEAVAAAITALELPLLVIDPVLASTSGARLLDDDGLQMLCADLLPLARVVTPNVPEAEVLSGKRIVSDEDVKEAARRIHDMGVAAIIITGGHRAGSEVVDTLFDGRQFSQFRAPRVGTPGTHGTGCTFAAAVAAYLALGRSLADAAELAQKYVAGGIEHSLAIGKGHRLLDHFWKSRTSYT
jgi:hydroxymethylpyrimidine/phosphomethylpyrimidine kinase